MDYEKKQIGLTRWQTLWLKRGYTDNKKKSPNLAFEKGKMSHFTNLR